MMPAAALRRVKKATIHSFACKYDVCIVVHLVVSHLVRPADDSAEVGSDCTIYFILFTLVSYWSIARKNRFGVGEIGEVAGDQREEITAIR